MKTAAFLGHSQDARQQRLSADKARRQVRTQYATKSSSIAECMQTTQALQSKDSPTSAAELHRTLLHSTAKLISIRLQQFDWLSSQAEKSLVKLHDRSMPPPPPPKHPSLGKAPGSKAPSSMGPPAARLKHSNPFLAAPSWEDTGRPAVQSAEAPAAPDISLLEQGEATSQTNAGHASLMSMCPKNV